jgi:hypothetical protein
MLLFTLRGRHGKHHVTRFLCGPFQGCCLATTIGKTVYSLYKNGKQRCYAATIKVFSLWSDPRLYNKDRTWELLVINDEVIIGFSSSVWSYEEVLTQYGA